MQYRNNLKEIWGNSYFEVITPFRAYILIGHSESNTFVGSSQMLGNVYRFQELKIGDEIHDLHGGVFAVIDDVAYAAKISLSEKHPFEKTYGPPPIEKWPVENLRELPPEAAARKVDYNPKIPMVPMGKGYGRGIDSFIE